MKAVKIPEVTDEVQDEGVEEEGVEGRASSESDSASEGVAGVQEREDVESTAEAVAAASAVAEEDVPVEVKVVRMIAPPGIGSCGVGLASGECFPVRPDEDGIAEVPVEVKARFLADGWKEAQAEPMPSEELEESRARVAVLTPRREVLTKELEEATAKEAELEGKVEKARAGLAAGTASVVEVAGVLARSKREGFLRKQLGSALEVVERELGEVTALVERGERERERARQQKASLVLLRQADRALLDCVISVRKPVEDLERYAALLAERKAKYPLSDEAPLLTAEDLARKFIESSVWKEGVKPNVTDVAEWIRAILDGPTDAYGRLRPRSFVPRADRRRWAARFHVNEV